MTTGRLLLSILLLLPSIAAAVFYLSLISVIIVFFSIIVTICHIIEKTWKQKDVSWNLILEGIDVFQETTRG